MGIIILLLFTLRAFAFEIKKTLMHLYKDIALFPPTSRLQIEYLEGINNADYQNFMTPG